MHSTTVAGRSMGAARSSGFTLLEMLVAIAVAGILLAIAVPSFRSVITSNRLTVTANDYVAALSAARTEAIKLNRPTQFCSGSSSTNGSDQLGQACGTAATATVVALKVDNSTLPVRSPTSLPQSIQLSSVAAVRYADTGIATTPSGTGPYSGLVVDISSASLSTGNHRCIYLVTGSAVSTCKLSTSCPLVASPSSCLR